VCLPHVVNRPRDRLALIGSSCIRE
jgi:hypothetical protein